MPYSLIFLLHYMLLQWFRRHAESEKTIWLDQYLLLYDLSASVASKTVIMVSLFRYISERVDVMWCVFSALHV